MTADDDWFADVCRHLGRTPPDFDSVARKAPKVITAGVISKPKLVLVTMRFPARGLPQVDVTRSSTFELEDRSARAVQNFSRQAKSFVGKQQISQVYLRTKSERGEYVGHAWNFKMEAVLQLVPGLELTFVNTNSIGAWIRRQELGIGLFDHPPLASWSEGHLKAAEAALFVAEHYGRPRYFSDGSACHD